MTIPSIKRHCSGLQPNRKNYLNLHVNLWKLITGFLKVSDLTVLSRCHKSFCNPEFVARVLLPKAYYGKDIETQETLTHAEKVHRFRGYVRDSAARLKCSAREVLLQLESHDPTTVVNFTSKFLSECDAGIPNSGLHDLIRKLALYMLRQPKNDPPNLYHKQFNVTLLRGLNFPHLYPVVELMVQCRADIDMPQQLINRGKFTCLTMASQNNESSAVTFLLAVGASVNGEGNSPRVTPLGCAAARGHGAVCRLLIDARADVNAADENGKTPLHIAEAAKQSEIVKLLSEHHPHLDPMDNHEFTPLMMACSNNNGSVVLELLKLKADPNLGSSLFTPMTLAARNGFYSAVRSLLDAKGDPNLQPKHSGLSPLIEAMKSDEMNTIVMLLEAGAEMRLKNSEGNTAAHLAAKRALIKAFDRIQKLAGNAHEKLMQLLKMPINNPFNVLLHMASNNADFTTINKDGETAIDFAIIGAEFQLNIPEKGEKRENFKIAVAALREALKNYIST